MMKKIINFYRDLFEVIGRLFNNPDKPSSPETSAYFLVGILSFFNFLSLLVLIKAFIPRSAWLSRESERTVLFVVALIFVIAHYFIFLYKGRYKRMGIRLDVPITREQKKFAILYILLSIILLIVVFFLFRLIKF